MLNSFKIEIRLGNTMERKGYKKVEVMNKAMKYVIYICQERNERYKKAEWDSQGI